MKFVNTLCVVRKVTFALSACMAWLVAVASYGSGYAGDMADSWRDSRIVVLGQVEWKNNPDMKFLPDDRTMVVTVEKAYKGAHDGDTISFVDPSYHSTAASGVLAGRKNLVFLQSDDERRQLHMPEAPPDVKTALRGYTVGESELPIIESALSQIQQIPTLAPAERKQLLLECLSNPNKYTQRFIEQHVQSDHIVEAIPYFQRRLEAASRDSQKIYYALALRGLGDESMKDQFLRWLDDKTFTARQDIITMIVAWKDPTLFPRIRALVNDEDELVAVHARYAMLQLGEPDAKELLFDALQTFTDPVARFNAIFPFRKEYKGLFSDKEKAVITTLINDPDPSIAWAAEYIVKKWQRDAQK